MKETRIILLTLALGLGLAVTAAAQPGGRPPPGPPPPEAFAACENQSEGEPCEFDSPRGDHIEGSCEMPRGDELVCVPADAPPPPPPPR